MNESMKILLTLKDRFNYEEYSQRCVAVNEDPDHIAMFAQKAGMLEVAMRSYAGLAPERAYIKMLGELNQSVMQNTRHVPMQGEPPAGSPQRIVHRRADTTCGSCGGSNRQGGKVR